MQVPPLCSRDPTVDADNNPIVDKKEIFLLELKFQARRFLTQWEQLPQRQKNEYRDFQLPGYRYPVENEANLSFLGNTQSISIVTGIKNQLEKYPEFLQRMVNREIRVIQDALSKLGEKFPLRIPQTQQTIADRWELYRFCQLLFHDHERKPAKTRQPEWDKFQAVKAQFRRLLDSLSEKWNQKQQRERRQNQVLKGQELFFLELLRNRQTLIVNSHNNEEKLHKFLAMQQLVDAFNQEREQKRKRKFYPLIPNELKHSDPQRTFFEFEFQDLFILFANKQLFTGKKY